MDHSIVFVCAAVFSQLILLLVEVIYIGILTVPHQYMVSEGMQNDPVYHVLLSAGMLASIGGSCSFFLVGYSETYDQKSLRQLGCFSVFAASVFWIILVSNFEETIHIFSTIAFLICTAAYTIIMFMVGSLVDPVMRWLHKFLMLVVLTCVLLFTTTWASASMSPHSWIPQHVALVFFPFAQIVFFLGHGHPSRHI